MFISEPDLTVVSTDPRLLPPRPDLDGARRRLFECALQLFGDRGYHAVSVRDLMSELGQQPGALYFHVASKEHLLYELMRLGLDVHRERLKEALLDAGRDAAEQVHAVVEAHVRVHAEYTALARVTSRELRTLTGEMHATVLAMRDENSRILLDVVERGVRLGAFTVEEPFLAVQAIGAMGVRVAEWWTPDSPYDVNQVARTYADFALKMLG